MLLAADTPRSEPVSVRVLLSRSLRRSRRVPAILGRIEYWRVFLVNMFWMGSHFAVVTWLPRYARDALALPPTALGLLPAIVPIGQIVGTALASRADRSAAGTADSDLHRHLRRLRRRPRCARERIRGQPRRDGDLRGRARARVLFGPFFISLAWVGGVVEPDLMATATGTMNGMAFIRPSSCRG